MNEAKRQASAARKDERRESMTRRSRDGTFARNDGKNFLGFKQHSSHGVDMPLVREFVITTASVHDSRVDLSIPGMPCYRDRGYQGAPCRGINGTMDRASRNTPLTMKQVRRNLKETDTVRTTLFSDQEGSERGDSGEFSVKN
jgi:IS5 family transposase